MPTDAACHREPFDRDLARLFFSEDPDEQRLAKTLCSACPSRSVCLSGALARHEREGIWGGYTYDERCLYVAIYGDVVPAVVPELPMRLHRSRRASAVA